MSRPGSALIELMVTLVVGSMVIAAGVGAVGQLTHARSTHEPDADVLAASVRRSVIHWIRTAQARADRPFDSVDRLDNGAPADMLSFVSASAEPWSAGEARVRLRVERDGRASEHGFIAEIEPLRGHGMRRIVLVPDAVGMDIRFMAANSRASEWQTGWTAPAELPRAVQLTLHFPRGATSAALHHLPLTVVLEEAQ